MSVKTKNQLNKVVVDVVTETKVDNRKNNPGRPVNKKSARYIRLQKQAFYSKVNAYFKKGNQFKINSEIYTYKPCANDSGTLGSIVSKVTGHECNVEYIGRTKVKCYAFVLNKQVKI